MPTPHEERFDVVIIGGGPAGSSSATVLSQAGYSVLVLERLQFPRFHIGESMLTYSAAIFDQLGVGDAVRAANFPVKKGAEFCNPDGSFRRVDFADQGQHRMSSTYQVERADFDQLLLEHASASGATVRHGAKVTQLVLDGERVTGVRYTLDGTTTVVHARRVIDASGRAGVIANQHLKARKIADKLRMVAVFKHFGDVDETTNPGTPGDIQIGSHPDGWVWAIPIRPDKLSVGTVTRPETLKRLTPEGVYAEHLARIPRISGRVANATPLTGLHTESDFTYYSETVSGPGFFVVGDAGCFVDPIFSAGVLLAIATGMRAGKLTADLLAGRLSEADAIASYDRFYKTGYDTYFRLIYAFYEHDFKIGRFLKSSGVWVEPVWVARLLGGDFWSEKNALANHLRGIAEYQTFAPFEPLFGCPVYPGLDEQESADVALDEVPAAVLVP
ncbi:NAD(P)/FAD-dependent oxidoreductase [Goodfellowiella coeruleoviolacea]|uniref:FADH2-dependent halogenase n=1 Tax=Goodfellowiella coeruleoviolacea TaxID=334858 RepID=A0AAE3GL99_9PSEU|nr:NAD(P)/FAD-dependent oxidoreductase [Goodfellowiella coeruleoviolacea]MCP2170276.1 FADH2-dependent halogenase [Goodfellowiella coeruleoviolacea]